MVKKERTSKLLFKKLLRSVKTNYKQFLSVIAISFLAICLFCGLTSNAKNLEDRVNYLYDETNVAEVYLTTTSNQNLKLDKLKEVKGVTDVEERIYYPVTNDKRTIYLICEKESNKLSHPMLVEGEEGFLITDTYSSAFEVNIGDDIMLSIDNIVRELVGDNEEAKNIIDSYKLPEGEDLFRKDKIEFTVNVTGTMMHPEGVETSNFSPSVAVTNPHVIFNSIFDLISSNYDMDRILNDLEDLFGTSELTSLFDFNEILHNLSNQVLVKTDGTVDIDALSKYVRDFATDTIDTTVITCTPFRNLRCSEAIAQDVDQARKLTYVFPVIFFLVSILVILTTLSQMILKERMQIGALKAIGVSKWQIYLHYISYGALLCFIGGILGFFLGPVIIPNVMNIKYKLLWDIPDGKVTFFQPMSILMTLVMIGLAGLVSYLVSRNEIKEKPVDTLRPKAPKDKKKDRTYKDNALTKHVKIETKLAFRNIFRNKLKSFMVVLGTLGCTALLVCGFGIMDTLNYGVNLSLNEQITRDMHVLPLRYVEEEANELKAMPEVKRVEEIQTMSVILNSNDGLYDNVNLNLLEDDSLCFNVPYYDDYLTIDQTTAKKLKIKEGEEVEVVINQKIYKRTVKLVFETSFNFGIYCNYKCFDAIVKKPTSYWLTLNDNVDKLKFKTYLEDNYDFIKIMTDDDYITMANDLLGSITNMTNVVKIFAILLAIVVIYNLTSLNINERSRDIATFKVLGFNSKEIRKTLVIEIMVDTIVGAAIGLLFGFPICVLMMSINKTNLLTFLYHINWYTYLFAFAISVITALVVDLILCLRTNKIEMVESLKSNE